MASRRGEARCYILPFLKPDVSRAIVVRHFEKAAPRRWNWPSFEEGTALHQAVESLREAPDDPSSAEPPLARFARSLATDLPPGAAGAVQRCLASCPPPEQEPAPTSARDSLLIVELEPESQPTGKYLMRAWVGRLGVSIREIRCATFERLDDAKNEMTKLRDEAFAQLADEFDIEVFLPHELMHEPVDEWFIKIDELGDMSLGELHPLVLRSLLRAKRPEFQVYFRNHCERNGAKFMNSMCTQIPAFDLASQPSMVQRFPPKPWQKRQVFNRVRGSELMIGVLEQPPYIHEGINDAFLGLVTAGVPVLIWGRSASSAHPQDSVQNVLSKATLGVLRETLFEARKEGSLPHPITLLWDDIARPRPGSSHRLQPLTNAQGLAQ